jgi:osmoprotectant transport system permease protein
MDEALGVTLLNETAAWLADPGHWAGRDGIPTRIGEHVLVSAVIVMLAVMIALPIGVWAGHTGRGGFLTINVANIGRALPSMALLALMFPLALSLKLGFGFWPTVLALVPLGIPPILTNSYVSIREVDRDIVEAARGMGLRENQVLSSVELPIALPIILAGIRNAAAAIVATATLGALVAGGGLGRYIVDGIARQEYPRMVVGAVLVALLVVVVEVGMGLAELVLVSEGVRGRTAKSDLAQESRPR